MLAKNGITCLAHAALQLLDFWQLGGQEAVLEEGSLEARPAARKARRSPQSPAPASCSVPAAPCVSAQMFRFRYGYATISGARNVKATVKYEYILRVCTVNVRLHDYSTVYEVKYLLK